MKLFDKKDKVWMYLIGTAILALLVINIKVVLKAFHWVFTSISLVVYSFIFAYLLNIIMVRVDHMFDFTKNSPFQKYRRIVSLLITFVIVGGVVFLLLKIVIPQLANAGVVLIESIPKEFQGFITLLKAFFSDNPQIVAYLSSLTIDWSSVFSTVAGVLTSGIGSMLNFTLSFMGSFLSFVFNSIVVLILSIYILLDKERFFRIANRLMNIYLEDKTINNVKHIIDIVNSTFSNFVIGKVLEAIILGSLIAGGMWILKLPYPIMIGTLVGVINILPLVGAYIGGGIGVFMVFTVSPTQAIVFLVYLCVVQQLEANLIYPKIAGNTLGLPGVYVLMAVIVCGSLAGILGMVLGIPLVASGYKIIIEHLAQKEKEKLEQEQFEEELELGLQEELKQEIKEEIKDELKEEIKVEIAEEIAEDIKKS